MNNALFQAQLNTADQIITYLKLDQNRKWYPEYSGVSASNFKGLKYLDVWGKCVENQLYDFILRDHSLIQFRVDTYNPLKVGYAYLECPYVSLSYEEFVEKQFGLQVRVVGDELIPEYEQYVIGCPLKDTITPLRYDYAPDYYQEGRHPASHVHFGYGSNIRVGTRKLLVKPLSFLLLVIRQCYPDKWILLLGHKHVDTWCRNVRENLDNVDGKFWGPKDLYEIVLG